MYWDKHNNHNDNSNQPKDFNDICNQLKMQLFNKEEFIMMRFTSLLEAAELAKSLATDWRFAYSSERYDVKGLLTLAQTSDSEDPIDEGCYYVVSASGAIGYCDYNNDIDWLFISDSSVETDLPSTYQLFSKGNFCSKCGNSIMPSNKFCGNCGNAL